MAGSRPDSTQREARTARRLGRLFRIERAGGFVRRTAETVWRLIERRGALAAELGCIERARRAAAAPSSPELDGALRELAAEICRSRDDAEARVAVLRAELDQRRGRGAATGLRSPGAGRLLGSG